MSTKRTSEKPIRIKRGNVTVTIYKGESRGYKLFQVADYTSGKRVKRNFSDEAAARREAEQIAIKLSRGDVDALTLTSKDKTAYVRALELLKPSGAQIEVAALHFAEAVKVLGGDMVIEAARFYAKRHVNNFARKTVSEVFELLVQDAKDRKLSTRYIEDLRYRCGRFATAFKVQIASVAGDDVRAFLSDLKLSPRSYNNFLGSINRLFEFARERKFLAADHNELDGIKPMKDGAGEIEIYTPAEIARLLSVAKDDILPSLVIGAFAGLRSAEISRLDWANVKLAERHIVVTAGTAKTAARRIVPISDNLAAWLAPHAKESARVWPKGHAFFYERLQETSDATGSDTTKPLAWKRNALRHSFISYRCAQTQNVNQVALESGNSPKMIFAHYRELVTAKQGAAWFSISPEVSEKVVPLAATGTP